MALSKNKVKLFHSLLRKKQRDELGLFIVEGEKAINQLIEGGYKLHTLAATNELLTRYSHLNCEKTEISYAELKKISALKTPQGILALFHQARKGKEQFLPNELTLALDSIQDPGNLGTIIRLASWFGIKQIVCSATTVDCYNPKVIQATMGAIADVQIYYTELPAYLAAAKEQNIPVYGTFLEGDNIYQQALTAKGIVVLGNEGNGISEEVAKTVSHKLFIPSFAGNGQNVESLNVSMATAIICSEFKRNTN